jgi:predicted PurR-regulated permease PerM
MTNPDDTRAPGASQAAATETPEAPDSSEAAEDTLHDYLRVDGEPDLGEPGRPLARHSPFYIGFFGALGVIVALTLQEIVSAASSVILLVAVAMFLAVGLNPAVEWFMRQGLQRRVAVLTVFVALVAVIVLFGVVVVPVISEQVQAMASAAPDLIEDLQNNRWVREVDRRFDLLDRINEQIQSGDIASQVAGGALGVGRAVVGALINVFFVFVLTLYFLSSLPRIKRSAYSLVPASRRERVSRIGDAILRQVGGYVSGAFIVAFIAAITSLIFFFIVGLADYAVALAFAVLLLDLVPMIGATIAMVLVSLVGLAVDWRIGLACAIYFIVYQQIENYLIYPRVMASSVNIPGAVIVIAVLAGGTLLGVVGALLAIPIAAGVLLIVREVVIRRQEAR